MRKNCELCGFDLAGEGIKDLIPLCHTCYVHKNAQVIKYLAELKELGKDNVYTNKPACKPIGKSMICNNCQYRYGTQPVYVGPVTGGV